MVKARKFSLSLGGIIKFNIVGPCALESLEQVRPVVELCKKWNIPFFRSQIFKPRTCPSSFQGLGTDGVPIIDYIKSNGLNIVTEACSAEQLSIVSEIADVIQIGARNMQNFELLKSVGTSRGYKNKEQFVILKRGFSNNFHEWINAAKYLENSGVPANKIILCERGSRNHASPYGITLDFGMAIKAKLETNYKVIVDPSHGSRHSSLVLPLATIAHRSNMFDGAMIEVHPNPTASVSDAGQAISVEQMDLFLTKNDINLEAPVAT